MGCVSSRLATGDFDEEKILGNGNSDYSHHVVRLISSTYGALKLDETHVSDFRENHSAPFFNSSNKFSEEPECINAWELMCDIDDDSHSSTPLLKTSKNNHVMHTIPEANSSVKVKSHKTQRKYAGKENKHGIHSVERHALGPNQVLRPLLSSKVRKKSSDSNFLSKNTPMSLKRRSERSEKDFSTCSQSFSPLFQPDLLETFERALDEGEQIKNMGFPKPRNRRAREMEMLTEMFEKRCPKGGENAVVIYTTTLRGIRKTFEDCNVVRSTIESYQVRIIERDISMDSGFKEELRDLMDRKEFRVPVVFVKGRLIGGAEEILKLEEEEKLQILLEGIPIAMVWCEGCGGMRFIMCTKCRGSCKILDSNGMKMMNCQECNENGLVQCPVCCY